MKRTVELGYVHNNNVTSEPEGGGSVALAFVVKTRDPSPDYTSLATCWSGENLTDRILDEIGRGLEGDILLAVHVAVVDEEACLKFHYCYSLKHARSLSHKYSAQESFFSGLVVTSPHVPEHKTQKF